MSRLYYHLSRYKEALNNFSMDRVAGQIGMYRKARDAGRSFSTMPRSVTQRAPDLTATRMGTGVAGDLLCQTPYKGDKPFVASSSSHLIPQRRVRGHVEAVQCFLFDFDIDLCQACNDLSRDLYVRRVFRTFSRLGDGVFWYTLMIILLAVFQGEALRPVLHMIAVGLIGTLIYKLIKHKTLRPRPFNVYPSIVCTGNTLDQYSFPSGHTMHAVSFSILAIAYFPFLAPLLVPFSLLVALSRPVLGLHYPSDVLMGATLGAVLASGSLFVSI